MANMSYCRFENTASDLADCLRVLEDFENGTLDNFADQLSSHSEKIALHRLIGLCKGIVNVVNILEEKENKSDCQAVEFYYD